VFADRHGLATTVAAKRFVSDETQRRADDIPHVVLSTGKNVE
jgi:hypothetical protein